MSRASRRSASLQQLTRRSSENENIFNFSSDVDINSKRNWWWKNLSDNDRRSLLSKNSNSNSIKRLNSGSNASDELSPNWWKNLSDNGPISMKLKNVIGKEYVDHEITFEKQTTSSDESDIENVFPKKSIFPIEELRTRKSRYSHAFNLQPEKATQEDHNTEQPNQDVEIEDLNATESDTKHKTENERRKNKKRRKQKKLFSRYRKKRRYSDVFTSPNTEFQEKPETQKDESLEGNIDILQDEKQDSITDDVMKEAAKVKKQLLIDNQKKKKYSEAFSLSTTTEDIDNVSKEDIKEKKKLFQVNLKKKKYSEAFAISTNENLVDSETSKTKNEDTCVDMVQNEDSLEDNVSFAKRKKDLFQLNLKKKKYSEAFAISTHENLSDNETSEEEVVTEEVIIQIDTSHVGNHSLRTRNSNSSKIEENIQKRDSTPDKNRSLRTKKNNDLNNESRQNLQEEIVQNEDTIEVKKDSEAYALSNSKTKNEDTCVDMVQNEDSLEDNVSIAKRKKELFQLNLKKKKYSEAFAISTHENLSDNETLEEEVVIEEIITQKDTSHAGNRSLRTRNINSSKIDENIQKRDSTPDNNRSLRTKKNNDLNNKSRQNLQEEIVQNEDTIEVKKYSEAYALSNSKTKNEDTCVDMVQNENSLEDNVSIAKGKKELFQLNLKKKKYSAAFAISTNENLVDSETSDEEIFIEEVITQKDTSHASNRNSSKIEENIKKRVSTPVSNRSLRTKKNNDLNNESRQNLQEEIVQNDDTMEMKKDQKRQKYSQAFAPSESKTENEDTSVNIDKKEDSLEDNVSIKAAKKMKELFELNRKKKKYSEAFAISTHENLSDVSKQSLRTRKSSSAQEDEKTTTPTSNRSLRTRKNSYSKIDEQIQRASTPASNRSLKTRISKSGQVEENLEKISASTSDRNLRTMKSNSSEIDETTQPVSKRSPKTSKSDSPEQLQDSNKTNKEILVQNEDSNEKNKCSESLSFNILSWSDTSEEEIFIEDVLTQKDASLAANRSLRTRKSNSSGSENKKNLSRRSEKKTLDSSKKENISEKTPQSNRRTRSGRRKQDSSNEKESTEVDETILGEDLKTPKKLFSMNQQNKKYSEAFLNIHETPQNPTDNIEHTGREVSSENMVNKDTKEKQTTPLAVQELLSKRKESLDNKNPKCSEAFMELMAMQKPLQEDLHVPSQNIETHINKELTDVRVNQLHSDDDTPIPSISSIDISNEIKHPLFRPTARKSLYSAREEQKSIRKSKIHSEEERSTKKISKKRMSLRSTSPADSVISKFFEESLISSTKLFINPNGEKSGGSDESAKKRRASNLRKISGMNENAIVEDKILEDNPLKNTVPIETVPDTRDSAIINENKIDNEEIMESVELKRNRKSKSLRNISENSNSSISEKSHHAINKNNTQQNIETEEINRVTISPSLISRKSKSSVRNSEVSVKSTSRSRKQSNSLSVIPENLDMNRNASIKINENNNYFENAVSEPVENLLTPKSINEIEKKSTVSKIPRTQSSLSSAPVRISAPENTKSKNIPIEDSSFSDDDPLEILLTPVADLVAKRKKHSSTINKESPCSNVISIRSTDINERLNPAERIENWLSESVMANNLRKSNILSAKRESESSLSEEEILRRKKLLKSVVELRKDKQKKSAPTVPAKKITDFYRKLDKNEKLNPIPKNTNTVKKVSRPVCTATLVDGKPYRPKKLFRGERWCSTIFYKFLQKKMADKYGDETRNESENVMKSIVQHVKTVIKSKKYLKEEVDKLKIELAQRNIISTHYEFYLFCFDYLPAEYRDLVVPMTQAYTSEPTVPYNQQEVFKKIILD